MLSVLEKAACLPHYHTAQYKQRDHIRDRHQTVKDIRDGPYCLYGHVRSDEYCKDIQPAIGQNRFFMATGQVLQTTLTVVIQPRIVVNAKNTRQIIRTNADTCAGIGRPF